MQLSLASEGGSPRASNTKLRENGHGNPVTSTPLAAIRTNPALPRSVLYLRSITSSSSQASRMNKFSSTSSDDFDSKEPVILTENVGADNDSDSISSPTDNLQNAVLFNEFKRIIESVDENNIESDVKIKELRDMILKYGLPSTIGIGFENISSLRSKVWKLVLGVPYALDLEKYLEKSQVWAIFE